MIEVAAEPRGLPPRGRLLGIDFGAVRLGISICDPDRILASPLETYTRRSADLDAIYLQTLITNQKAVGLVVGLAISLDGTEGPKARECRAFGEWLRGVTGLPALYWDERFTTSLAEDSLREAGVKRDKRKGKKDRIAAQFILQAFLDAGCPAG